MGQSDLTICVAAPRGPDEAESFVRAHIERLPGAPAILYGGDLDQVVGGEPMSPGLAERLIPRLLPGSSHTRYVRAAARRRRARFLTERGVNVVLAEFGMTGVRLAASCAAAGVPLVVQFHGYDAHARPVLDRWSDGYRSMFRVCAAAVAVSRHMAEKLERLGAPAEKVHVNSCGADIDLFHPTDPAANPPVFVAVGRFVEKKAPHLTLAAFRTVLDACSEARLVMAGDGDLLPVCRDLAGALGMAGSVEFAGEMAHDGVARTMQGARAFVQHSVTASSGDSEGSPVAVLEAGACGLPVVATRHAGIPEAVVEGETGFLVEERDTDGMAEHMIRLAREPGLAARLGAAGRERIAAEFSMAKSIEALCTILSEAAEGR